ncbi:MAG: RpiB/LacA/LacB family sugar-phosphate isomerase [Candidatus Gracilibacteria bacterium]|nr:RpiB/LacA/LacB family sugar-phosphate isomerase [Candidatus Peregrinibacteria bacterium]
MSEEKQHIYIGGDKKAHKIREEVIAFLKEKGYQCVELGIFNGDETSYERIEFEVMEKVHQEEPGSLGILFFGTQEGKKLEKPVDSEKDGGKKDEDKDSKSHS